MCSPVWLPALVLLRDAGHDWDAYMNVLYLLFRRDFIESKPTFNGRRLGLKRYPLRENREATFWHLITEGPVEARRQPAEERCERIRWPRPTIDHFPCADLQCWENRRKHEKRIVIALADFSYIVVLAERSGYLLPWSAYPVERDHHRRKLQRECEQFHNSM